jgi:hypothetical protein
VLVLPDHVAVVFVLGGDFPEKIEQKEGKRGDRVPREGKDNSDSGAMTSCKHQEGEDQQQLNNGNPTLPMDLDAAGCRM